MLTCYDKYNICVFPRSDLFDDEQVLAFIHLAKFWREVLELAKFRVEFWRNIIMSFFVCNE